MGAPGTELRKICSWAVMALVVAMPAISVAEEQSVELSLSDEGLIRQVCVGPYEIEVISADPEADEYYSARPLTFGEQWARVNKVLFGNAQASPSNEKVTYAYEPELWWTVWQESYLEGKETKHIGDWGKAIAEDSVGVPVAIVEYAEKDYWWKPKQYMGTYLPIVEIDVVRPEDSTESEVILEDPVFAIIQNKLKASLNYEVETHKLLGWRETYCTLGSLSHNKGLIGLPEAYEEIEPYKVFFLNEKAEAK